MKIIDYGYKIPELTDKDFWDSYNFDVTRLSTHNHDGNNSTLLRAGSTAPYYKEVLIADWTGSAANWRYDLKFPSSWLMKWLPGTACPVQVIVRNAAGNVLYLEQSRYITSAPSPEYGVSFYSVSQLDCNIAYY